MSERLLGKVAIVTGAARGQGEATARLFVEEGARVVIADVLREQGESLAELLGENARFIYLDVSDEANWNTLVEDVTASWGRIDVLVNNAGILLVSPLVEVEKADFEKVLNINLLGSWAGIKAVAPVMEKQGQGSIINVCSTAALWGMHGTGAYLTSKWALRGMTKTAAMELGWKGIRVNAIFPGGVNTPFGGMADRPSEEMQKDYVGQPIQRIGEPSEVAYTNLFLASDESSYLCGSEIAVDGGQALGVYRESLPGGPPEFTAD